MKKQPLPGDASIEELRMDDLKALHFALLGQHVQRAQPSALASRIRDNLRLRLREDPVPPEPSSPRALLDEVETPKPLDQLTLVELQQRYLQLLGHPTVSNQRRHLERVIQRIDKAKLRLGSAMTIANANGIVQTKVPLEALARIDDLCQRLGIRSRSGFLRQAIFGYLVELGETEVAHIIAPSL